MAVKIEADLVTRLLEIEPTKHSQLTYPVIPDDEAVVTRQSEPNDLEIFWPRLAARLMWKYLVLSEQVLILATTTVRRLQDGSRVEGVRDGSDPLSLIVGIEATNSVWCQLNLSLLYLYCTSKDVF